MHRTLDAARERQGRMAEDLARAQSQLLAEQERLRAARSLLREREARLASEREALAAARARDPARIDAGLAALAAQIARLPPAAPRAPFPYPPPGPGLTAAPTPLEAQLASARLALARGDESQLRLSLDSAAAWLAALYDPDAPGVAAVRAQLDALRRIFPRPDLERPGGTAHRAREPGGADQH